MKFSTGTDRFTLAAICALTMLAPAESFASLNDIACSAIQRGCYEKCGARGGKEACYESCDDKAFICQSSGRSKQQTPPPPCRGIHCTLRNPHPPTTVGPPTRKPRPVEPVKPVGVSNPNKTNTGNDGPVILYRKNESGSGHGQRH